MDLIRSVLYKIHHQVMILPPPTSLSYLTRCMSSPSGGENNIAQLCPQANYIKEEHNRLRSNDIYVADISFGSHGTFLRTNYSRRHLSIKRNKAAEGGARNNIRRHLGHQSQQNFVKWANPGQSFSFIFVFSNKH